QARAANLPKTNIETAIKKGTGDTNGPIPEEMVYEGYGPGGVAILVEVLTDNKNRAASEVRHAFSKYGGNLGEPGSVAWMFAKKGSIVFEDGRVTEEQAMEVALEAGAEDVIDDGGGTVEIHTAVGDFETVKEAFEKAALEYSTAEITFVPSNNLELEGKNLSSAMKLLEALDDLDDVQKVWSNLDFSDEAATELE
ncbi:MAG: YebC/PmpR family DNA-binding transcriptional regulator, partial [Candidatus Adiutrix sp.]|nr:YebC/PmpR family DNA-binding transcriptional regulator [Candidatus Adiutrix sp.]